MRKKLVLPRVIKPFAFILLLLHINFSMFIAQVDEQDAYEATGRPVRDVDSLTDWLQQSLRKEKKTGHHNDKKDDSNARFFHILKPHHFFSPHFVLIKKPTVTSDECFMPVVNDTALFAGFSSLYLPPPKV